MKKIRTRTVFPALAALLISAAGLFLLAPSPASAQAKADTGLSFFITSTNMGHGANLGGLAGADAHCRELATVVGAGARTWRAYLSTQPAAGNPAVNARDRIGSGPWYNAKGVRVATSVDDLHSPNNKLNKENSLTEKGLTVNGRGDSPNQHDILTGSTANGMAFPAGADQTCANWTSESTGKAMLGHHDRHGAQGNIDSTSWNQAHLSRGCSPKQLDSTGGSGYFYCFAANATTGIQQLENGAIRRSMSGFAMLRNLPLDGNPVVYVLDLPARREVEVAVFTLDGRKLADLLRETRDAGRHEVRWNGMDLSGNRVSGGFFLIGAIAK